jgi:hypothetical protein
MIYFYFLLLTSIVERIFQETKKLFAINEGVSHTFELSYGFYCILKYDFF